MNFYYDSGNDDLNAAVHYSKVAFKNLFKAHKFAEAEKVFDAYENLLEVLYDLEDGRMSDCVQKEIIDGLKTALEKTQSVLDDLSSNFSTPL